MKTQTQTNNLPLRAKVAIVTGASRGAGRGIAAELGAAGTTVYVTGRSTRDAPSDTYDEILRQSKLTDLPGNIDETADEVTRLGGVGIAVRCDHTDPTQVDALFDRVLEEQGQLDVLVNNAWGAHECFDGVFDAPFWQRSLKEWDAMFNRGVRNHVVSSHRAAPIFVRQRRGLIVTTTFWDRGRYLKGMLMYDLAKAAMNRLAFAMAEELREHGVASVAVAPGWMRTEFVLAGHDATEATWRDRPSLARTESPRYLGRAVVALAGDAAVLDKSGQVLRVADLAQSYGFTDIDGRQVPAFEID